MEKPARRSFRQETVIHSYFIRPISLEIVRLIWNTNITPNNITIFRVFLNILSLIIFAFLPSNYLLIGISLFIIHEILDHVDGMLAREKQLLSKNGATLEIIFDILFSTSGGLLGLSIATWGYNLSNEIDIYLYFIFLSLGSLTSTNYDRYLIPKQPASLHVNHDTEVYLQIFNTSLKTALKNILLTMFKWRGYILFTGMICELYLTAKSFSPLKFSFVIVGSIEHLKWIRRIYLSIK